MMQTIAIGDRMLFEQRREFNQIPDFLLLPAAVQPSGCRERTCVVWASSTRPDHYPAAVTWFPGFSDRARRPRDGRLRRAAVLRVPKPRPFSAGLQRKQLKRHGKAGDAELFDQTCHNRYFHQRAVSGGTGPHTPKYFGRTRQWSDRWKNALPGTVVLISALANHASRGPRTTHRHAPELPHSPQCYRAQDNASRSWRGCSSISTM